MTFGHDRKVPSADPASRSAVSKQSVTPQAPATFGRSAASKPTASTQEWQAAHPSWCSALSADEPLPGTAAHQRSWVLLEQASGWGRDILDGESLGALLASRLTEHLSQCDSRLLFIRRPGREGQLAGARRLFLCDSRPGEVHTRVVTVDSPDALLELDLSAGGHVPGVREVTAPLVLVCAHGRRDQCCAVRGRPVAAQLDAECGAELSAADPDVGVWESSHTGGHRFAPTLLLPGTGYTYGSGDFADYRDAVAAALDGRVGLAGLRGRSCWTPPGQVAEVAVRAAGITAGHDELTVIVQEGNRREESAGSGTGTGVGDSSRSDQELIGSAIVEHRDGRRWQVEVARRELPPRPASCGKGVAETWGWEVHSLSEC